MKKKIAIALSLFIALTGIVAVITIPAVATGGTTETPGTTFEIVAPDLAVYGHRPITASVIVHGSGEVITDSQPYGMRLIVGMDAIIGGLDYSLGPGVKFYRPLTCGWYDSDAFEGCLFFLRGTVPYSASIPVITINAFTNKELGDHEWIRRTPITPPGSLVTTTLELTVGVGSPQGNIYLNKEAFLPGECMTIELELTAPTIGKFRGELYSSDPAIYVNTIYGHSDRTWDHFSWNRCLSEDVTLGYNSITVTFWTVGNEGEVFLTSKDFFVGRALFLPLQMR
jgi:hypothetical protein